MASAHFVTHCIGQLRAGDPVAAQHLWEGYTTEEIAANLGRAPRTVERKPDLIRRRWNAWRIPPRSWNQEL
jgi:IS30 family transposase